MLVTSIFSFSHIVFKRPYQQWGISQKSSFCGKRLKQQQQQLPKVNEVDVIVHLNINYTI